MLPVYRYSNRLKGPAHSALREVHVPRPKERKVHNRQPKKGPNSRLQLLRGTMQVRTADDVGNISTTRIDCELMNVTMNDPGGTSVDSVRNHLLLWRTSSAMSEYIPEKNRISAPFVGVVLQLWLIESHTKLMFTWPNGRKDFNVQCVSRLLGVTLPGPSMS